MQIIENQHLWLESLLSYRTRIESGSLTGLIRFAEENIDAMDLEIRGSLLFSITERIRESDRTIIGVELLAPVDRKFSSNTHYVFKPKFRLENAVLYKYCGELGGLEDAVCELRSYIALKNLQPITEVYYLVRKIQDENCIIDVYIGVNGNSL